MQLPGRFRSSRCGTLIEDVSIFYPNVCCLDISCVVNVQCQNGHLACTYCSEKGISCSACSRSISRIKNVALDKVITSATVGCKYTRLGCREVCNFLAREAHEKFCPFEPKPCSVPGCNQIGYEDSFSDHLKTKHNVDQIVDLEDCTSGGEYSLMANICLDSSNSEVLLTHQNSHDRYLLHQESTSSGELLHITSLEKAPKRKYEIAVEVNDDQTYCYKSMTTSNTQQQGQLLVPKHSGAPLKKMRCRIKLD